MEPAETSNGLALALGALLDGIPESIVLGSTLLGGADDQRPLPGGGRHLEPAGRRSRSAADLRREGHARLDHARSGSSSPWRPAWPPRLATACWAGWVTFWVPLIQSFAAGAILTMLVDTMIPEAYEGGGNQTGLVTVAGFALAFLLTTVD